MKKRKKILLISDCDHVFVRRDQELLKKYYDVDLFFYEKKTDRWKLLARIPRYDINISWYILGYSYIAVKASRLFGKRSILLASGWDIATIPEINYGWLMKSHKRDRLKYMLKNADVIAAVSEDLKSKILKLEPECNVEIVYNGVDPDRFSPSGRKEEMVITVATRIDKETIYLKGLNAFTESARLLPNVKFAIIGRYDRSDQDFIQLKNRSPPNLTFPGFLEEPELVKYYRRARVYAQLSAQESFGVALAEAMLCECVPVVTDRGAMPEVVAEAGFYVPFDAPKETAEAIKKALRSGKGKIARERIRTKFNIKSREKRLKEIIDRL